MSLITNSIQFRFSSEATFEKLLFQSQNISYTEVMKELSHRKKIHLNTDMDKLKRSDKIDNIQLINLDKNGQEINDKSEMIEANTKILVKRLPMKILEPMEVSYNQMNNPFTKYKDQKKLFGIDFQEFQQMQNQLEDDGEASSDNQNNENEKDNTNLAIADGLENQEDQPLEYDSYSLDIKQLESEFTCPLSTKEFGR